MVSVLLLEQPVDGLLDYSSDPSVLDDLVPIDNYSIGNFVVVAKLVPALNAVRESVLCPWCILDLLRIHRLSIINRHVQFYQDISFTDSLSLLGHKAMSQISQQENSILCLQLSSLN